LYIKKPFFQGKGIENIITGFTINSKDKRFFCDYYKFSILNFMGWDENGEDIYLTLKELKQEVSIDSISYKTLKSFTENKEWWQIHNELSLKKKILLVEKKVFTDYYYRKKDSIKYYVLPMIYEGTRKNIVPTDLSKK
jgi:hypothetical protein